MKTSLHQAAMYFCAILFLHSCATSSISQSERKASIENSKETTASCFVEMNDGTIKNYNSLQLVTSAFSTPYLLADGKTRIKAKQINAYQNKDHYAISQKTIDGGRISHVATQTLPGFAIRTVKGKINIYCKQYYNGQVAIDEYYIQAGNEGKIMVYSQELINSLVKDNSEAFKFFNNRRSWGSSSERLLGTAHLYNNAQLMTRN